MARDSSASVSEAIDLSLSLTDDPQSHVPSTSVPSTSSSSPSPSPSPRSSTTTTSDPSLSRNLSLSRLNAKAPEFVPRATAPSLPSPSSTSVAATGVTRSDLTQARTVVPTPPPQGMIHVYSAPNSSFHVPIQMPLPVQNQNHFHHRHQHHHNFVPAPYHHHNHSHQLQFYGGSGFGDQQEVSSQGQASAPGDSEHPVSSKSGLPDDSTQKILNQVEYYFGDLNLATTDHLMRFINKDPEGYVPISVVASFKKIKALINSNSQLAGILRNSKKLIVSEDGKKVKRINLLTESDMEELQSRIIVAENLPEDHCHQNLMKVFSSVGSVKTIRTCQPQVSNGGASSTSKTAKTDAVLFSNKLHAFVEYESIELAERAVADLNDEGNWRNGLRVRLLHKRTSLAKTVPTRVRKAWLEGEALRKEDDASTLEQHESSEKQPDKHSQQSDALSQEHAGEEHSNGKEGGQKKGRSRGRGKGRGRNQYHHQSQHGSNVGSQTANNPISTEPQASTKQPPPPGPRMPDGTRGFSLGRGKPVSTS